MGLPCTNIFGWNILSFPPNFYISNSWVKREKRKGRFILSSHERVRLMGTWSPSVPWWLIISSTLHSFCFDFSPWIEGYSRMLRPASNSEMSHFHESILTLYKVEKKCSYMLKNRYRREQGRDLHTHLSMGLPWFLQRQCYGGAEGAKSSGRAPFGCNTLSAPTESF